MMLASGRVLHAICLGPGGGTRKAGASVLKWFTATMHWSRLNGRYLAAGQAFSVL